MTDHAAIIDLILDTRMLHLDAWEKAHLYEYSAQLHNGRPLDKRQTDILNEMRTKHLP